MVRLDHTVQVVGRAVDLTAQAVDLMVRAAQVEAPTARAAVLTVPVADHRAAAFVVLAVFVAHVVRQAAAMDQKDPVAGLTILVLAAEAHQAVRTTLSSYGIVLEVIGNEHTVFLAAGW